MKRVLGKAVWIFGILCCGQAFGEPAADEAIPAMPQAVKNWRDLRFGMFIHWGPVSLMGKEIGWSRGREIPVEEYDSLYKRFNPTRFHADEWVAVAKAAGMKYIVLTTKHHDGFCLWDTKETDYNIMNSPFGRDVVKELSEACKRGGIRFGAYYSVCDWHHPDFPLTSPGGKVERKVHNLERYTDYLKAQNRELLTKYGPLLTIWYDVGQKFDAKRGAGVINLVRGIQPDLVVNNRTRHPGDYDTPEQRIGAFQIERPWETCMTICRQWAWKPNDQMKSLETCVHSLLRTIGGDGNFLFNVGPQPDGLIEPRQVERLKEMGAWVAKHADGIYATRGGPWKPSIRMASTRKGNQIYLFFLKRPASPVTLPGIPRTIQSAAVPGGGAVAFTAQAESLTLAVPESAWDGVAATVVLTVEGDAMTIEPVEGLTQSNIPGAKASASAVFNNKVAQYGPDKVLDGDSNTRWATPAGMRQCWLQIDFANERTFSAVELDEECCEGDVSRVKKYELQKLADGNWVAFHSGEGLGRRAVIKFQPVTARALRLNILDATNGPTFSELRLR
ncbi:MAG: alpha-L-fucosidase [Kiritimatiellae bacterium]|nr:alpha-L-fucosidase [Kiritimatiellia bacterium]